MEVLKAAIYNLEDLNIIKSYIGHLTKDVLEKEENGLDILHHTIFVNYGEVVRHFLECGYFAVGPIRGPSYLHLSCLLGRAAIANIILDFRSGDYYAKLHKDECPDWKKLERMVEQKIEVSDCTIHKSHLTRIKDTLTESRSKLDKFTDEYDIQLSPLDIGAIAGHLNIVKLLLSTRHSGFALTSSLENAVRLNSPRALQFLLESEEHTADDVNTTLSIALKRKEAECMSILLQNNAIFGKTFNGINPYHVLYTYSLSFQTPGARCRGWGLDECTLILLSWNQDVNAREPLCTYPLYSLLHALVHEKKHFPSLIPSCHITTLEILLEAGADVNFDEVAHGKVVAHNNVADGYRECATSGLNALFMLLQTCETWRNSVDPDMERCCLMLLEHGADPNYIDSYGESPLHDLMKLWAMQHTMGNVHLDFSGILYRMLEFGADPNIQSTNGLFAIHYYFKILFNLMGGLIAFQRWKEHDVARKILKVLDFMEVENANCTYENIILSCLQMEDLAMSTRIQIMDYIERVAYPIIFQPKPLQYMCQMIIWHAVNKNKSKINVLPLPKQNILDINEMFSVLKYC